MDADRPTRTGEKGLSSGVPSVASRLMDAPAPMLALAVPPNGHLRAAAGTGAVEVVPTLLAVPERARGTGSCRLPCHAIPARPNPPISQREHA